MHHYQSLYLARLLNEELRQSVHRPNPPVARGPKQRRKTRRRGKGDR